MKFLVLLTVLASSLISGDFAYAELHSPSVRPGIGPGVHPPAVPIRGPRPGHPPRRPGGGYRPPPPVYNPPPGPHRSVVEVHCSANYGGTQYCPLNWQVLTAAIVQEYSSYGLCSYGRTWGYDQSNIWVSGGCSARFQVQVQTGGYNPPPVPAPHGYVTCSAYSRGLTFSATDIDDYRARSTAVMNCRADHRTSNSECEATVSCSHGGGYNPPPPPSRGWTCTSSSRGISYAESDYNRNQAERRTLSACTARGGDRNECVYNLRCY